MRKIIAVALTVVTMSLLVVTKVSANWYAGNERADAYGVWAFIRTPSTAPQLVPTSYSGQSNWVSTPGPNWIQTGWNFYWWETVATKYVETCIDECNTSRYYAEFGTQAWGSTSDYLVEQTSGTTWCAYIDGIQRRCQSIRSAPTWVQVFSEIKLSPFNKLDTLFDPVYFKNATGVWSVFD